MFKQQSDFAQGTKFYKLKILFYSPDDDKLREETCNHVNKRKRKNLIC
jgi:hypothetical protein